MNDFCRLDDGLSRGRPITGNDPPAALRQGPRQPNGLLSPKAASCHRNGLRVYRSAFRMWKSIIGPWPPSRTRRRLRRRRVESADYASPMPGSPTSRRSGWRAARRPRLRQYVLGIFTTAGGNPMKAPSSSPYHWKRLGKPDKVNSSPAATAITASTDARR